MTNTAHALIPITTFTIIPSSPPYVLDEILSSLQASNQSTSTRNQTVAFNPYGDSIANLVVDGVSITIMCLVLMPCLIVYFKRKSFKIAKNMMENLKKCCGNESTQQTSKGFFYILIHSTIAFIIFRIGVEAETILQHSFDLMNRYDEFIICLQVRRILDYIGMYWFLLNYSLMIPIWLKVCIIWIENKKKRLILTWIVYVLLIVCNILAILGLIPVIVVAIVAMVIEKNPNVTFDSERYRSLFSYAITTPLLGSSTAIVFFMSIIAVAIIVSALKRANRLHPEDSEVYKMQKQTIIKLTSGVAIIGVGVVIESIGVAISTVAPNWIMYPLAKLIPYSTLAVCVSLIFWPYKLPIINSEPLQFVIQELKFKAKEMVGLHPNHSVQLKDDESQIVELPENSTQPQMLTIDSNISIVELNSLTPTTNVDTSEHQASSSI